jgi:tRNA-specific 2-thiouridylase
MEKQRVVVGLSGGVDSAVSAWLLKQAGHEVIGIFMKNWEDDDDDEYCSSNQDFIDAAAVADVIGIELEHVNFAAEYRDRVFAEFLREYQAGRTPNPDVLCNAEIKFKAFLDHAMRLGASRIATGHYARVRCVAADTGEPSGPNETSRATARDGARARGVAAETGEPSGPNETSRATAHDGARARGVAADTGEPVGPDGTPRATARWELLKGLDPAKDQSYFLHRLTQAQLARTLFPLGELHKSEVRRIAAEIGLPVARKKDSTGICFIGERPFREFLARYLQTRPGPIQDERGRTIGRHVGLSFYTLGQRQGLGIGGLKEKGAPRGGGEHAPWFVARKDMARNTLVAVQGHDHPWLLSRALAFDDASWVAGAPPVPGHYAAKTRYRQQDAACTLAADPAPGRFRLRFTEAQWAVTPGQSAVLYDGEVCLGGGVITAADAVPESTAAPLQEAAG